MPPRLEQRACGDLAMYWRARGDEEAAAYWAYQCGLRDFLLPPERGHGQDGSYNFAPCLLAGAGLWDELNAMLEEYWRRGAGNEFNSPLYGARVLTAAILSALLDGSRDALWFVQRWVGFLALQAVVVRNQPRRERFTWASKETTLNHQIRNGVAVPPTGMRINGDSLGNPYWGPVLAEVLGIGPEYHHIPKHWLRWRENPPRNKREWAKVQNAPNPWALVETISLAEEQCGRPLAARPFMRFCKDVVEGDMGKWHELARKVQEAGVPLPRGIKRFVVERCPPSRTQQLPARFSSGAVMTWWDGVSPTRQKPSVPAAKIEGRRTRILMPAKFQIPSTQTMAWLDQHQVMADSDTVDRLQRLTRPSGVAEFH